VVFVPKPSERGAGEDCLSSFVHNSGNCRSMVMPGRFLRRRAARPFFNI
jgi:hypothetical protein